MTIYLILLLSILVAQSVRRHTNPVFAVVSFVLTAVSALRYGIGTDYYQYMEMVSYGESLNWVEPGYKWVNLQFFKLQLPEWSILSFFSLVTLPAYFLFIKRYSANPLLSLLFFFLLGYYFASFNAVRQMFAMVFLLFAMQLWLESRRKLAFLALLFATLFHYSILIALPFYGIALYRPPRWVYLSFLIITALVSLSGVDIISILATLFRLDTAGNPFFNRSPMAIFKIFVPVTFLIYLLLFEWSFIRVNYVRFNLFFLYVLLGVMFHGINYFIRINYYFEVWLILLLPDFLLTRKHQFRIYWSYIFIIYFIVLFWVSFMILNGHGVIPYRSLLEISL